MPGLYGCFVGGGNGVVGLEGRAAEGAALEASPEFWRMIEGRRRRATRLLEEAKAGLFAAE